MAQHADKKAKRAAHDDDPTGHDIESPVKVDKTREILQQSMAALLQAREQIENRLALLEQKEKWFQETEAMKKQYIQALEDKICLDIGGKRFSTTRTTLLQQEGSFFHAMLTGGWSAGKDGSYFVDRNPQHVDVILDFLRMRAVDVTSYSKRDLETLAEDLDFFQIHAFPFPVFDDLNGAALFNRTHADLWFPTKKFQLIYKATRDGLHQESFAKACHNKGPTLVFIKSVGGQIFGGYNPLSWGPTHSNAHDPTGFIFLNNASHTDLIKFPIIKDKPNILHKSNYVFIFGNYSIAVAPDQVGRTSTRNFDSSSYASTHWVRSDVVDTKETHFYVGDIEVFLVQSEKKLT
jgi:hypothetical protein